MLPPLIDLDQDQTAPSDLDNLLPVVDSMMMGRAVHKPLQAMFQTYFSRIQQPIQPRCLRYDDGHLSKDRPDGKTDD